MQCPWALSASPPPLIHIWLLLVSTNEVGAGQTTKLEDSKWHFTNNGWCLVATWQWQMRLRNDTKLLCCFFVSVSRESQRRLLQQTVGNWSRWQPRAVFLWKLWKLWIWSQSRVILTAHPDSCPPGKENTNTKAPRATAPSHCATAPALLPVQCC